MVMTAALVWREGVAEANDAVILSDPSAGRKRGGANPSRPAGAAQAALLSTRTSGTAAIFVLLV
jgi:hypothetical protein